MKKNIGGEMNYDEVRRTFEVRRTLWGPDYQKGVSGSNFLRKVQGTNTLLSKNIYYFFHMRARSFKTMLIARSTT